MTTYIGIDSSADAPDRRIHDKECVNRDLYNMFMIEPGEVRGRPTFGSTIKRFLAEPDDDATNSGIQKEIERVVGFDPRVETRQTEVYHSNGTIMVRVMLDYIELDLTDFLEFELAL